MRHYRTPALFAMTLAMFFACAASAQETSPRPPAERPRAARQTQKDAADPQEKAEGERAAPSADETMRAAISDLSTQIGTLTVEMKSLRRATEHNSMTIELLLYEERLGKVEEKLDGAIEQKGDLDAREAEIQRRMKNIQQEAMLRGGLHREDVEAALRAEYQRALEDTKNRQSLMQQRIAELQTQAARLRERVEALQKKLERAEEKSDKEKSEKPRQ